MMQTWSGWKRFSNGAVDVPAGPGVYEVRHTLTGRVLAFGHSADLAKAVEAVKTNGEASAWARLLGRQQMHARVSDLEYRTCCADNFADAKTAARRLLGLRQSAWRRRIDIGWAGRYAS
jgi:hypothetical protein